MTTARHSARALLILSAALVVLFLCLTDFAKAADDVADPQTTADPRPPANDDDLRFWLQAMAWRYRYAAEEIQAATGMTEDEQLAAFARLGIRKGIAPPWPDEETLHVLPYPGGRHPRIGFLDGAIRPQRETKFGVFLPWDEQSYVVVDLPEAIWSNLGLTYLAHTHVPTLWTQQGIELQQQEWQRGENGALASERTLPNGIRFGASVQPEADAVRMELWLENGTSETLSDLRVQNCVMLRGAAGFDEQTNDNKRFLDPYVACCDATGRRWIITAWEHCQRAWGNAPCPCLHSDPQFPDCPPGETRRLRGWLSFFEGDDLEAELRRIDGLFQPQLRP